MNERKGELKHNPDYEEESFIYKILKRKFEAFNIKIDLPDELIMLIEVCTESNPGMSQLLLKDVLDVRKSPNVITSDDFAEAFGDKYPILSDPSINMVYEEKWEAQKIAGAVGIMVENRVDTPEFWED